MDQTGLTALDPVEILTLQDNDIDIGMATTWNLTSVMIAEGRREAAAAGLHQRVIILFGSQSVSSGQMEQITIPKRRINTKGAEPTSTRLKGTSGAIP